MVPPVRCAIGTTTESIGPDWSTSLGELAQGAPTSLPKPTPGTNRPHKGDVIKRFVSALLVFVLMGSIFASTTGFLSAVQGQDLSVRTALDASFTQQLQNADPFRFDASDLMPPEIGASLAPGGFWGDGGGFIVPGKSIDDATQAIDLFCVIVPEGDACP